MQALAQLKEGDLAPSLTLPRLTALLENATDTQVKCAALAFRAKLLFGLTRYSLCRLDCEDAVKCDPKDILCLHVAMRLLWLEALHTERGLVTQQQMWPMEPSCDWSAMRAGDNFREYFPDLRLRAAGRSIELIVSGGFKDKGSVLLVERPVAVSDDLSERVLNDPERSWKLAIINDGRAVTNLAGLRRLMEEKGRPMRGVRGDKKGLFLLGSQIVSTCEPNCAAVFVGNVLVVIATASIHSSLSDSVYPPPTLSICWVEVGWPRSVRLRQERRYMRGYHCKCRKCLNVPGILRFDWPEQDIVAQLIEGTDVDLSSGQLEMQVMKLNNPTLICRYLIHGIRKKRFVV
jgi:hypothetical protein